MASSDTLKYKVVIVTGGSRGIGEGCVRLFADNDATVVFCAPKAQEEEGKKVEREVNALHEIGKCSFVHCDVTREEEVRGLIEETTKRFGRIDYLINCAGWHPPQKPIDGFSSEEFVDLFNLNVLGSFMTCKYALPHIRKSKGSIVNISSVVGVIGQRKAVTYVATKGAVIAMTKALAIDEAQHGVRVNCVSPGSIDTPLLSSFASAAEDPQAVLDTLCQASAIPRLGKAEEVAKVCLFLIKDASYVTGHNVMATGGVELGYGVKM